MPVTVQPPLFTLPVTPAAPAAAVEVHNTNTTRLEGTFEADVLHDVLIDAGVRITGLERDIELGQPELLSSEITSSDDGRLIVENRIEISLVITTREELTAFASLLDDVHIEGGTLTMAPTRSTDETVLIADDQVRRTVTERLTDAAVEVEVAKEEEAS